jgi:hypothetical protein
MAQFDNTKDSLQEGKANVQRSNGDHGDSVVILTGMVCIGRLRSCAAAVPCGRAYKACGVLNETSCGID